MGRSPCCSKVGLRRGPWSTKEDTLLTEFIQQNGEGQWRSLPKKAGLLRCGKSCRLRWMNYLRPGIVRGNITEDEEDLIVRLHGLLGNRWSLIAGRLPGRTDNEIKNYWNTHLLKKLKNSGMDIPKPAKIKKSGDGEAKKRRKQRKGADGAAAAAAVNEEEGVEMSGPPKTKVYLPKPIRVSSEFSRTSSYDSLVSDASDKAAEVVVSCFPVVWPPLFELEDANYGGGEEEEEDFLHGGYITPLLTHADSDVHMLDKVYDEYLQLL